MFPKECWYVACTPDELSSGPLGRRVCGDPLVIFRTESGQVVALEDFCPHRGAPLSLGAVQGEVIRCGYHGMQVDALGMCAGMAGQQVEKFKKGIRSYPVCERYGYVWVWPGKSEKASADLIPNLYWADHPEWVFGGGMFNIQCDYRLLIDNLMDLTHETYVHASSIGQPEIEESAPVTVREGNFASVTRVMENIMAPPFWRAAMQGNNVAQDLAVDRWQVCRFSPPSHVMIDVGVAHTGMGGVDAPINHRASGVVTDFITPETASSCWYFWGMARNFAVSDAALTDQIRESQRAIFTEDLQVLEAQQRRLAEYPGRPLMNLNIDRGGMHARHIIDELIALEQSVEED